MNRNKLLGCMAENGYNRSTFAIAIDMPYYTLLDKLRGRTKISVDEAEKMVQALNISGDPARIVDIFFTTDIAK